MGDIAVFLCLGFLLFLVFIVKNKAQPEKSELFIKEKKGVHPPSSPSFSSYQKHHVTQTRIQDSSYKVHIKKTTPILPKGWMKKSSIKQAFILSEILKRKEDL